MKTLVLLTVFLIAGHVLICQTITPKLEWKEGDNKNIATSISVKTYVNDAFTMDSSFTVNTTLIVKENSDSFCRIQMSSPNPLLEPARAFYKNISDQSSISRTFVSKYKINKSTLSFDMINKEEYDSLLSANYNEIIAILKEKAPDKVKQAEATLNKKFSEIKKQNHNDSNSILDLILLYYKIPYSLTDTVFNADTTANPFNLPDFNGARLKTYAEKINQRTFKVTTEKEYDFEVYKELLKKLAGKVQDSLGHIGGEAQNAEEVKKMMSDMYAEMFSSMKFEASEKAIVTARKGDDWPLTILDKAIMRIISPSSGDQKGFMDLSISIN